jgi:hypothetical protein
MRRLACVLLLSLSGCAALDFDGDPDKLFEFRFGWERGGVVKSTAKPGGVDANGVYEPETAGAKALLFFPSVSAGLAFEVAPEGRMTPTVGLEAFRFKLPIPYARWWTVQVQGGANLADIYLGKLVVPIVDVTVGPWFGWDFDEDAVAWGIGGTIFKF